MTALTLSLPTPPRSTGQVRYGVEGGVCAGVTRGAMGRFDHASVVANPRPLLGRQDGRQDIGAGVREDGDTR